MGSGGGWGCIPAMNDGEGGCFSQLSPSLRYSVKEGFPL